MENQDIDLDALKARELDFIFGKQAADTDNATQASTKNARPDFEPVWGLALSGGGIRSATFALGVLQSLARQSALKHFAYLSSVSGGGYIGGFVQALIHRTGFEAAQRTLQSRTAQAATKDGQIEHDPDNLAIGHLRKYSNYLAPKVQSLSGDTLGLIAIVLTNILLNLIQFSAFFCLLTLLPFLLLAAGAPLLNFPVNGLIASGGILAAACVMTIARVTRRTNRVDRSSESPLYVKALTAFSLTCLLTASSLVALGFWIAPNQSDQAIYYLSLIYLVSAVLPALMPSVRRSIKSWGAGLRYLIGGAAGAATLWVCLLGVQWLANEFQKFEGGGFHFLILGPVCVVLAGAIATIPHIGIAADSAIGFDNLSREIRARLGGKALASIFLGVALPFAVVIYGPYVLSLIGSVKIGEYQPFASGSQFIAWVIATLTSLHASRKLQAGQQGGGLNILALLGPPAFILGLFVLLSSVLQKTVGETAFLYTDLPTYLHSLATWLSTDWWQIATVALGALAIWLVMAVCIDVNEFGQSAMYRNRLTRCYLGASCAARKPEPITNFDPDDDLPLAAAVALHNSDQGIVENRELRRPLYPLVNTAMNLVSGDRLDWQNRKAAAFLLSPFFCGYIKVPSDPFGEPVGDQQIAGSTFIDGKFVAPKKSLSALLSLGSAVAVSGAAASSNMGYHTTAAASFLLTLFNARLGWWLPNRRRSLGNLLDTPPIPGAWLLREMLGITNRSADFVNVSDGGHFENLGIYELVRRRCDFIVVSDAGADGDYTFEDLGNAIRKCRVDFGAEIEIDVRELRPDNATGLSAQCCAIGKIVYANRTEGVLVYLKPALCGNEPTDISNYAKANPQFPHQSTIDQFFDESQFESYRRLGIHVTEQLLRRANEKPSRTESYIDALSYAWTPPSPANSSNFTRHSQRLAALFAHAQNNAEVDWLARQLYANWPALEAAKRSAALAEQTAQSTGEPSAAQLRQGFYFCQQLIQLMEDVYTDLQLERYHGHPDNRGWMNLFRQWAMVDMLRGAWAISASTFGLRFQNFCKKQLGLPSHEASAAIESLGVLAQEGGLDESWQAELSESEVSLLTDFQTKHGRLGSTQAYLLKLQTQTHYKAKAVCITAGIALIQTRNNTQAVLAGLRIRRYLRSGGIGRQMLKKILTTVENIQLDSIDQAHDLLARKTDPLAATQFHLSSAPPKVKPISPFSESDLRWLHKHYPVIMKSLAQKNL